MFHVSEENGAVHVQYAGACKIENLNSHNFPSLLLLSNI
jgi:hypothetical protein